jgi:hypothetical protein
LKGRNLFVASVICGKRALYQISKSMTDIHARMLAKPAFVVTPIKKNGITCVLDITR